MPNQKPITKTDLDKALKTTEDKLMVEIRIIEEKLTGKLASKDVLKKELQSLEEKLMAKLASQDELRALRFEFLQFKDESMRKDDERFDRIVQTLDKMSGKLDDLKIEKIAAEHTFLRHENRLDNHETRVATLEEKVSSN